jgi:catechol-2,3-dioxygenase
MIPVQRLNHAVLYVRDASASAGWYRDVFGFEIVTEIPGMATFLRAAGTDNHHDLGLFSVGPSAPSPEPGRVGLYHLAWQVGSIRDLVTARNALLERSAYTGESDHGATKSIYGKDPDGNEFEIMWMVPRDQWTADDADTATVAHLNLDAEVARHG